MDINENRKDDRVKYGQPEFIYAELNLGKSSPVEKICDLKVIDSSKYGIGLIVTQKDFDILQVINEGDTLKDISFFAEWTMIRIDGTVRHKSRIGEGKYQGCYVLGIESPKFIQSNRPVKH